MATEFNLKQLYEVTQVSSTPVNGLVLFGIPNEDSVTLPISQFKLDLFNNPSFSGFVSVPTPNAGDNSQAAANTAWVQDELGSLGLNPATVDTYGTVRTNSTDAVPTVYLNTEVDAIWNQIRPVNIGGTGGTTDAEARSNLNAAKTGVNNDITELQALTTVPTVIQNHVSSANAALLPSGSLTMYAGSVVPVGWLPCDGREVNRITYAGLFSAIGTTYGSGNGSSTFNLPNFNGRFPMGQGLSPVSGVNRGLAASGGIETKVLSVNEMPSHNHGGATANAAINHYHTGTTNAAGTHNHSGSTTVNGNHAHLVDQASFFYSTFPAGGAGAYTGDTAKNDSTLGAGDHSHTLSINNAGNHAHDFQTSYIAGGVNAHAHAISSQGSGSAFSVLNPFLCVNFMIKI